MSSLKTFALCLLCTLTAGSSVWARPDLSRDFANCVGWYSARMEHAWLMQDPRADDFARVRQAFIDLLEAVDSQDRTMLNARIEAKYAMAQVLSQAEFGGQPDLARRLTENAEVKLQSCRLMLLGG